MERGKGIRGERGRKVGEGGVGEGMTGGKNENERE